MLRRDIVDENTAEWVSDRFHWLIRTLGPEAFFKHTQLLLPVERHFRTHLRGDQVTAQALFSEIRGHMGIHHWPVRLVERAIIGNRRRRRSDLRNAVAGSFYQPDGGGLAVITYHPELARSRNAFIGTMAHELAHYILAPHVSTAPGGEAEHEMLTDLAVIYAGFGVIDLQGAHDVGWRGYLDPNARSFALATFLRLKGVDPTAAETFLEAPLKRRLRRAVDLRDRRQDELSHIRALRPR